MATYEPPVHQLLKLGRPRENRIAWADYTAFGIGPDHVPELIRLLQDEDLVYGDPNTPEVYAQVHAWRALGQLKAEAAIQPLIELLLAQEDDVDWSDWITEDVPRALGMIGPAAFPPLATLLEESRRLEFVPMYLAASLVEIAKHYPELRNWVVHALSSVLNNAIDHTPEVNGALIAHLIDLDAAAEWPVIEAAFATGNVDDNFAGDAAYVKWELGLGERPTNTHRHGFFTAPKPRSAKERAAQRAKKRKAEKRKAKRNR